MVSQVLQVCRGDNTSTTGMTDLVRLWYDWYDWYDSGTTLVRLDIILDSKLKKFLQYRIGLVLG